MEFVDLFPIPGSSLTGHTDAVEHTIDTGDTPPIRCAPRRMSPQKIKQEENCVEEMLAGGQIEPSDSPWSAPVVLVTKKYGGTRFCVDYRWLNLATVKDGYPLPRIDDTLDMLAGKRWFSTLDLASRYWQALRTHRGRMMARWLHALQQFQFTIVHRAGNDHGNADGLSRAPTDPCRQCTRVDCPQVDTSVVVADQSFDVVSVGESEDGDLVPLQSGEDWIVQKIGCVIVPPV